jgi:hypothetical protein
MSILIGLTNYRPNFCCECGNKIVRLRWFFWTSRRFCDECFRGFAKSHWPRPAIALVALLVFGVLIGRGCRRAPPPLIIERPTSAPAQSSSGSTQNSTRATTPSETPTANEQVYICGARTKKGTPCSRRVHGPVRCWQHKGSPAMLPLEKLKIHDAP